MTKTLIFMTKVVNIFSCGGTICLKINNNIILWCDALIYSSKDVYVMRKITFICSNEHVYDLNVQYDLIWWEYAWMDFKPGMWISYMALQVFRITNLHCCQTHCTFLPILNSGFLIQTGNQYILFKKWNEFQIIRLIIEI